MQGHSPVQQVLVHGFTDQIGERLDVLLLHELGLEVELLELLEQPSVDALLDVTLLGSLNLGSLEPLLVLHLLFWSALFDNRPSSQIVEGTRQAPL